MRLTLAVPVYGQLDDTKGVWGSWIASIADKAQTELVVVNNDPTDGTTAFLTRFVFPHFPHHVLVENQDNAGVIPSMNQAIRASTGDIVAILHNDLYVYEYGWDERVTRLFAARPQCGLAGFFGAQGIAANGGRIGSVSNLLEAELHGERFAGERRVAGFDGLALIARRTMLDQIGGFDEGYTYHHMYDKSLSLESILHGWENWYIGVFCNHRSGVTANRSQYQTWISQKLGTEAGKGDQTSYQQSEAHFLQKYAAHLPMDVR